jgi:anti-sigma regulatory factor (Ser/Thr protein kinase)
VTDALDAGATHVRLVGAPVWPSEPARVREWQRYESVLNHVLAPFPVTLVCTYDTSRLPASIIEGARRTHPAVHEGLECASDAFLDPEEFLLASPHDLVPSPSSAVRLADPTDLRTTRRAILDRARAAGLDEERAHDVSLAVSEIVTNALLHGGGGVTVLVWSANGSFVCQIEDRGVGIADPLAGYRPPGAAGMKGRGLWLARQVVDLLQIGPSASGAVLRLHMDGAAGRP